MPQVDPYDRCFANRLPPGIDPAQLEAYLGALYTLSAGRAALTLSIGWHSPRLEALYADWSVDSAVGITAYNPGGQVREDDLNREAQRRLAVRLRAGPWKAVLEGMNLDPRGHWPQEPVCWIPGMDLQRGLEWGAEFGQQAIVVTGADAVPRLAFCVLARPHT